MAVDFTKILGKKADSIEKPKPLPIGSYVCVCNELPQFKEIGQNETPAAEFNLTIVAPGDDVDEDDLREFGGAAKIKGKTLRCTMWLSDDALYRTKQQLVDAFGIEEDGRSLSEMFNELRGKQVLASVRHRPSKDGQELYSEIDKLAAV